MEKFNKRWNMVSTDSYEESFNKFKTRLLNIFEDIDRHLPKESVVKFCRYYGIREVWYGDSYGYEFSGRNVINRLENEDDEKKLYELIELIFVLDINSEKGFAHEYVYSREILLKNVIDVINFSNMNVSIKVKKYEVILYPKGEKLLDEELVDNIFSFLNKKSNEHFIESLRFYQSKKYIKSAESLRRSLEEYLREKLKNKKGLNSNIVELQKRIKLNGCDAQIRNIINSTFNSLDQYFNDNSKHNDGDINDSENEFLIYQIGLLMRYINNII